MTQNWQVEGKRIIMLDWMAQNCDELAVRLQDNRIVWADQMIQNSKVKAGRLKEKGDC